MPGSAEVAPEVENCPERIAHAAGIAPNPVEFSLEGDGLCAVLAGNFGVKEWFADRRRFAQQYAIAVDAFAGDAIKAFGEVDPLDPKFCAAAGLHLDAVPAMPNPSLGYS